MRLSRQDQSVGSPGQSILSRIKKHGTYSISEKENIPQNILQINSLGNFKKKHQGEGLKGKISSESFKKKRLYPGSPGALKQSNSSISQSPGSPQYLNSKSSNSLTDERRKRSLTPKTIKQLLGEKKKKMSCSPGGESSNKSKHLSSRIGEILAKTKRSSLTHSPIQGSPSQGSSKSSSPLQSEPIKTIPLRINNSVQESGSPALGRPPCQPFKSSSKPSSPFSPGSPSSQTHKKTDSSLTSLACPSSPSNSPAEALLCTRGRTFDICQKKGLLLTSSCINHPNKKSKFFLQPSPQVEALDRPVEFFRGLCSKCAVRLANLGFQVEEIETDEEEKMKTQQFNLFYDRVKQVHTLTSSTLEAALKKQERLADHYQREQIELDKLDSVVNHLVGMLQSSCLKVRQLMSREAEQEALKFKNIKEVLEENQRDLGIFLENLQQNHEETLGKLDLQTLTLSIEKFEEQLEGLIESAKKSHYSSVSVLSLGRVEPLAIKDIERTVKRLFQARQEILPNEIVSSEGFDKIGQLIDELYSAKGQTDTGKKRELLRQSDIGNVYMSFDACGRISGSNNLNHGESISAQQNISCSMPPIVMKKAQQMKVFSMMDKVAESHSEDLFEGLTGSLSGNPLFILTPTEADFVQKQTPELGNQKEYPSDNLKFLYDNLKRPSIVQKTANESRDISVSLLTSQEEDLRFCKEKLGDQSGVSCQKSNNVSHLSDLDELFNFIGKKAEDRPQKGVGALSPATPAKQGSRCQKVLFEEEGEGDPGLDEQLLAGQGLTN